MTSLPGFAGRNRSPGSPGKRIARDPNRHLSFGRGGPHLCLGVHLARLEVKIVLAALAKRVRRFELAGEPKRIRSNFTDGLKTLPVAMIGN